MQSKKRWTDRHAELHEGEACEAASIVTSLAKKTCDTVECLDMPMRLTKICFGAHDSALVTGESALRQDGERNGFTEEPRNRTECMRGFSNDLVKETTNSSRRARNQDGRGGT